MLIYISQKTYLNLNFGNSKPLGLAYGFLLAAKKETNKTIELNNGLEMPIAETIDRLTKADTKFFP